MDITFLAFRGISTLVCHWQPATKKLKYYLPKRKYKKLHLLCLSVGIRTRESGVLLDSPSGNWDFTVDVEDITGALIFSCIF